ncbi:MAG: L-threonylcarbamoyladenylate synthase [Chloroflexi bacterium]|nr:L-threonylcarbamoyladenylate synthase [Chloroflexota bacterium]
MKTRRLLSTQKDWLTKAVAVLDKGGVVAFPTDTVYGVGVRAFDATGIERLYAIKEREKTKAVAVLIAERGQLSQIAEANKPAKKLASRFWPGPLTLVLTRQPDLPEVLTQGPTVGVRVPDHAVARALLAAAGPMAVTSANLSGRENTLNAGEVLEQLDGRIELIIDGGQTPGDQPSTVVDLTGEKPMVLRAGPVSEAEIMAALA